jgi:hypothetical protein
MSSRNGFVWPESGPVECPPTDPNDPDAHWDPSPKCGNGLHGWLWGIGDLGATCGYWNADDTKWLVVEVAASDIVDLDGEVKFPRGTVVFCGKREEAVRLIAEHAPVGTPVMFGTATAGYSGTATAGYRGAISITWWDETRQVYRKAIAEVDGVLVKPGIAYIVVDGKLTAKP